MSTIRKHRGKYQVQIRRKGHRPISKTFHQLRDAQEWSRLMEVQADRGDLLPTQTKQKHRLADLVVRYKTEITPGKKGSRDETIVLDAFLRDPICQKTLCSLTVADFAGYRNRRLKSVSSATLKRQLNPISHMFKIARTEWGISVKENLVESLRLKAKDNKRERRLQDGEQEELLEATRTRQSPYIEWIVIFAIETAMRRGEILGLQWDQVDLKRRSVTILESKNGYSRTIPLTPTAVALLHDIWREVCPSVTNKRTARVFPITANGLRMAWERMLKPTDIKDLHFHDLRHEAISRFFEMGLTVPEVASISGHRDLLMLMRYAHANNSRIHKIFDK
ncbi:site-specific integrase [Roseibium sp.]|uniref:site-specific integrase n=1 Tax=Roseibium sp. TaxID=1936156 RepID=UPI00391B0A42